MILLLKDSHHQAKVKWWTIPWLTSDQTWHKMHWMSMKIHNPMVNKIWNQYKDLVITNNIKIIYTRDSAIWKQKLIDIKSIGLSSLAMNFTAIDPKATQIIELCIPWLELSSKKCQRSSVTQRIVICILWRLCFHQINLEYYTSNQRNNRMNGWID